MSTNVKGSYFYERFFTLLSLRKSPYYYYFCARQLSWEVFESGYRSYQKSDRRSRMKLQQKESRFQSQQQQPMRQTDMS